VAARAGDPGAGGGPADDDHGHSSWRARSGAAGSGAAGSGAAGSGAAGDGRSWTGAPAGAEAGAPAGAAARPLAAAGRNAGLVRAGRSRGYGRRHDDRGLGAGACGPARTAGHPRPDARAGQHARLICPGFARDRRTADAARECARLRAAAEHATRHHDPAAEFQRAAEPDDLSEREHVVIVGHHSPAVGAGFLHARVAGGS